MTVRNLFDLTGRVVVVTGASQGIGRGLCIAFAGVGATVVPASRRLDKCEEVARQIREAGGTALALNLDVVDQASVQDMVRHVMDRYGRIDVLINNAGIRERHAARQVTLDEWHEVMEVNVTGVFLCSQAVGEVMICQRRGKIVNVSSILALLTREGRAVYAASKAAVSQLTRALAAEWAAYGVNVNAVAPALVVTPDNEQKLKADPERFRGLVKQHLVGRAATPEDIAGPTIFLAAPASDYITGQTIYVDGGRQLV